MLRVWVVHGSFIGICIFDLGLPLSDIHPFKLCIRLHLIRKIKLDNVIY